MPPKFDLDKIKFSIDKPTWERAIRLYESGKVKDFKETLGGYTAIVKGGRPYYVLVSSQNYDMGNCDCYLGQRETLCKHMVAVALFALKRGNPLTDKDKKLQSEIIFSGKLGELGKTVLAKIRESISESMRYIKPYNGPSRIWFSYQDSLLEGCNRLRVIFSDLPVSKQTTELVISVLLRLDKKLCRGGVDDSDGTVGGFIEESVGLLLEFAKHDPKCIKAFVKLKDKETCFGWEDRLLEAYKRSC